MSIDFNALTDEQLAVQYQATGCQDAFTTLYNRYRARIEQISRNQAKSAGVDVNEFISALNMKFWYCVQRFDPARSKFSYYVNIVFRQEACKVYRDERNKRADDIDNYIGIGVADNELHRVEIKTDIEAAVKGDKLMAEVVKRYMAGYSFEELARELGTYRMKIQRKIKRLAKAVSV